MVLSSIVRHLRKTVPSLIGSTVSRKDIFVKDIYLRYYFLDNIPHIRYGVEMSNPKPLLIIGDAVSGNTGLSRITRDLSVRIHEHLSDVYRLGTAGYGTGSRQFGFPQYHLETKDWVCVNIPEIWKDFAGEEEGFLFVIWDLSRLGWLSDPFSINLSLLGYTPQWMRQVQMTG